MLQLFTLNGLTGRRANQARVVPFATFELTPRGWRTLIGSIGAGIFGVLLTRPFIGVYATFSFAIFAAVAAVAMLARTGAEDGRRLWAAAIIHKHRSMAGQFLICGRPMDPDRADLILFTASTVPAPAAGPVDRWKPNPRDLTEHWARTGLGEQDEEGSSW